MTPGIGQTITSKKEATLKKQSWFMIIDKWYHHPNLGWIEKFNVEVYLGKKKKYVTHEECRPLDIAYLKTLNLKWRSASRVVEEPLDDLLNQGIPFLSI
jgi:hypothetical protein